MVHSMKLFKLTIKNADYEELEALVYTAPKAKDIEFLYLPEQHITFNDYVRMHKIPDGYIKIEEIATILTDRSKIILDSWRP